MAKTDKFRYSDLDFNFAQSTTKDVARKFDNNAIKQSLRNVVLTNFYERPFRPSLGANLVAKLFDQPSPGIVSEVQSDVRRAIVTFEPRVNLINVLAEYNDINQELKVQVEYSFLDEDDVLDITIERVR
jgi:phage baseplate assembly protein W